LKKPTGTVWFWFYKSKTEKTEPNLNKKKPGKNPSQTEKTESNQFEPVFVLKKRTETSQFELVSVFFKKNFVLIIFFYKNRMKQKMITSIYEGVWTVMQVISSTILFAFEIKELAVVACVCVGSLISH
jgi:hypothetical protein